MMVTFVIFALLTYGFSIIGTTSGIPIRENAEWVMLLCKFRNNSFIPHPKEWFVQWLTDEAHPGTIAYYFRFVSNGLYTISSSRVFGWFEIPYTKEELSKLVGNDSSFVDQAERVRKLYLKTKETCSTYARLSLGINLPSARRVITVVNDEDIAVFCKENGVLVAPRFMMTAAVSHEMVHSFFLGHSYSDMNVRVFPYARLGEYDDRYDLMSTANAFMSSSPPFGSTGPGLNGPHLDFLGWLPADRMYYFGRDGDPNPIRHLRLSSLSRPHHASSDWLLIMIPYDRDDAQKVYTVELRTKEYLDSGIPKAAVVIHQISRRGDGAFLYSTVLNQGGRGPDYELDNGAEWLVFLDHQFGYRYIRLRVDKIDTSFAVADVSIHSSFSATACKKTDVQRLAFTADILCVTEDERKLVQVQNEQRQKNEVEPGKCKPGYVPREAGAEDNVCVTLAERGAVMRQNERWQKYRDFYSQPTFGLNLCKPGFVWRQIDPYDYLCVEPSRKGQVKRQNTEDTLRRPTFLGACFKKFVVRKAYPTDDVCVTSDEQAFVAAENSRKVERLIYPKFFNGEDKVE